MPPVDSNNNNNNDDESHTHLTCNAVIVVVVVVVSDDRRWFVNRCYCWSQFLFSLWSVLFLMLWFVWLPAAWWLVPSKYEAFRFLFWGFHAEPTIVYVCNYVCNLRYELKFIVVFVSVSREEVYTSYIVTLCFSFCFYFRDANDIGKCCIEFCP